MHQSVQKAKVELSKATETTFRYYDGVADIETRVTRREFEGWIAEELAAIEGCVDRLLTASGVAAAEVDAVFLTGGTSFVPAVQAIFAGRFGAGRIRTGNEFTSSPAAWPCARAARLAMSTGLLLLRFFTGLLLASGFAVVLLIMFLHSAANFVKEGAGVLGYVVSLFASGFTQGTRPPEPRGWLASLPQLGLMIMFVTMFVTLFLPQAKYLLHVAAALGVAALIWYLRMFFTGLQLEIFCLPFFPLWFLYYGLSVR